MCFEGICRPSSENVREKKVQIVQSDSQADSSPRHIPLEALTGNIAWAQMGHQKILCIIVLYRVYSTTVDCQMPAGNGSE